MPIPIKALNLFLGVGIFLFADTAWAGPNGIASDGPLSASNAGTVVDSERGLMWAKPDNGGDFSWLEGKAYAESLTVDGASD